MQTKEKGLHGKVLGVLKELELISLESDQNRSHTPYWQCLINETTLQAWRFFLRSQRSLDSHDRAVLFLVRVAHYTSSPFRNRDWSCQELYDRFRVGLSLLDVALFSASRWYRDFLMSSDHHRLNSKGSVLFCLQ